MNRRELLGMGGAGLVAVALAARISSGVRQGKAPEGKFPVERSQAQWRALLTPASYAVLREGSTEPRYSSNLLNEHRAGIFACGGCGKPIFRSDTKYDSKTGWPSFWQALPGAIAERDDRSMVTVRTEVICANCGSHLGHVFDDGPKPTGLRYCMNGLALTFRPAAA